MHCCTFACLSWYPIQVIDIDGDDFLTLMDDAGGTKSDLKVSNEVAEQIRTKLLVDSTVMVRMMIIMMTNIANKLIMHVHFRLFSLHRKC